VPQCLGLARAYRHLWAASVSLRAGAEGMLLVITAEVIT
jgi:hypothetical protein